MTIKKMLSVALFVTAILSTSTSVAYAQAQKTDTNIVFDKSNVQMLKIEPKQTAVVIGISEANMQDFNNNPTPDKIKSFMQTIAPEYGVDWKLVYAIGLP